MRASLEVDCPVSSAPLRDSPHQPVSLSRGEEESADQRVRRVVGTHFDFVWRLVARLGVPPSSADDAAQEVFLVFARRHQDVARESERAFLWGTAVRVAAAARKQGLRERLRNSNDEVEALRDPAENPEQVLDASQRRAILDGILDKMPDHEREVFVLFELEGLTLDEIASLVGIPRGTAASRLRRSRETFAEWTRRVRARSKLGGES